MNNHKIKIDKNYIEDKKDIEDKEGKRKDRPIKIKIDINDIIPSLIQRIMNEYGVEWEDIDYTGKIKYLHFEIPPSDKDLCNDVMPTFSDEDGCGATGGGCLCGLPVGHEDLHICKRCGEGWESTSDICGRKRRRKIDNECDM